MYFERRCYHKQTNCGIGLFSCEVLEAFTKPQMYLFLAGQVQRDFGDLLKLIFSMRPDVQQVHVDDKVAADKLKRSKSR